MIVYEVFDGTAGQGFFYARKSEAVKTAREIAKSYDDHAPSITLYCLHLVDSIGRGREFAVRLLNGQQFVQRREEIPF